MNENILYCWLSRIDLSRTIQYFYSQNIIKISQLKHLSEEHLKKLDLNEVEKQSLLNAIADIEEDFNDDKPPYKLKLFFIKNCK